MLHPSRFLKEIPDHLREIQVHFAGLTLKFCCIFVFFFLENKDPVSCNFHTALVSLFYLTLLLK
jgi:hypothetical protein